MEKVNIDLTEQALLKGLAASDGRAIEVIYERNFKMIRAMVLNNNGSEDDARDIFQESMIVLYEKSKAPEFELNCQIRTYLYSVARRLWLKRLQQMQRYAEIQDIEDTVPVNEDVSVHEKKNQDYEQMESAMAGLGEPCRSLLEAFYLQRRSMHEIADSFGYTNADNAKNQKYKCLVRLKKLFFSGNLNRE